MQKCKSVYVLNRLNVGVKLSLSQFALFEGSWCQCAMWMRGVYLGPEQNYGGTPVKLQNPSSLLYEKGIIISRLPSSGGSIFY